MEHNDAEQFGSVEVSVTDDRWQLRMVGEISLEMRPRLDEVLALVASHHRAVDVDLGAVTFIDSSGIGFLARLGIHNQAPVRVTNVAELTQHLLSATGLRRLLNID